MAKTDFTRHPAVSSHSASPEKKRRRPYPRRRQPRKTPFTTKMWEQWLSERVPDPQSQHLRAGIEDFRCRVLISKEVQS